MFKFLLSACLLTSIALAAQANLYDNNNGPIQAQRDAQRNGASVETALRQLIASREQAVAVSAMFKYSRLGYRPDTTALLQAALKRGVFDNRTYLGELAHLFHLAPADKQGFIISEIDRGDGAYARQILASGVMHPNKPLGPGTRRALHDMLSRHEPGFSTAIGEFGMFDAFTYANWLHSVACLQAGCATAAYDTLIMKRLNANNTSPKKIIAYLASDHGMPFLNRMGKGPSAALLEKIVAYADGLPLPPNSTVLDWTKNIQRHHQALSN